MNFGEFLRTVPAFADFTQRELGMLEQAMVVRDYPDSHMFIREGKSADTMYLIVSGEVAVSRYQADAPRFDILERLHGGELFGLVSLIDHGPRSATCTSIGPSTVASLPRSAFELLFKADAFLSYHFQHLIARQLVRDLRIYTQALREGIAEQDHYKMFEALGTSSTYRGPERRSMDRRSTDRRHLMRQQPPQI